MCLSGSFFEHFPKSSSLICAILFRVYFMSVVLHDRCFFQSGKLSCGTIGGFSSPERCRATRSLVFLLRGAFVRHDNVFFPSGKLSCGTTTDIREISSNRAAFPGKFSGIIADIRAQMGRRMLLQTISGGVVSVLCGYFLGETVFIAAFCIREIVETRVDEKEMAI